jgi:hypothetical protein
MNSTNNNSFDIVAEKVFSNLYDFIEEDEKMTTNETKLHNDILG